MTQSRDLGYIDANVQVGPITGGARGAPIDLVRRERDVAWHPDLARPPPDRTARRGRARQPAAAREVPDDPGFVPDRRPVARPDRGCRPSRPARLPRRRVLAGGSRHARSQPVRRARRPRRGGDGPSALRADQGLGLVGGDRCRDGGARSPGRPDRQPLHDVGRGPGRRPALRAPPPRHEFDGPLPGDRDGSRARSAPSASCSGADSPFRAIQSSINAILVGRHPGRREAGDPGRQRGTSARLRASGGWS